MDLDVPVCHGAAIVDVRRMVGRSNRVRVRAAGAGREALGRLLALRYPHTDAVDVGGRGGLLTAAGLAAVFHLDTEGDVRRDLAIALEVAGAGEAGDVGRCRARFGAGLGIARVAELPVEHPRPAVQVTAAADEAVEVVRLEVALLLLALMHPVALDVVELVEAADAAARRADLAAVAGRESELREVAEVRVAVGRHTTSRDPAPDRGARRVVPGIRREHAARAADAGVGRARIVVIAVEGARGVHAARAGNAGVAGAGIVVVTVERTRREEAARHGIAGIARARVVVGADDGGVCAGRRADEGGIA